MSTFEIFNARKGAKHCFLVRESTGEINLDKRHIVLESFGECRLAASYKALNGFNWDKPESKPTWLYKADDFAWYQVNHPKDSKLPNYVRKSEGKWVGYNSEKQFDLKEIDLLEPHKKLIRCKQLTVTPSGLVESNQFIWETKTAYYRYTYDFKKIKYSKADLSDDELIALIEIDEEHTLYVYAKQENKTM